jgi:uncharacterized protein YuzE
VKAGQLIKVHYDAEVDVLRIVLSDSLVEDSDETKPGVVLDYDSAGNIAGIEIQDASNRRRDFREVRS